MQDWIVSKGVAPATGSRFIGLTFYGIAAEGKKVCHEEKGF